jgi:hypothetical protein
MLVKGNWGDRVRKEIVKSCESSGYSASKGGVSRNRLLSKNNSFTRCTRISQGWQNLTPLPHFAIISWRVLVLEWWVAMYTRLHIFIYWSQMPNWKLLSNLDMTLKIPRNKSFTSDVLSKKSVISALTGKLHLGIWLRPYSESSSSLIQLHQHVSPSSSMT